MTNLDNLKSLSVEGFAEWLDTLGYYDTAPWNEWFDSEYCNNCDSVECSHEEYCGKDKEAFSNSAVTCAYCELYNKCRYFLDMEAQPTQEEIITMWLRREVDS